MEHKRDTYYDDPKDNTAFERCIDVMSRLMLKYGPDMLEKIEREEMRGGDVLDIKKKRATPSTHSEFTGHKTHFYSLGT